MAQSPQGIPIMSSTSPRRRPWHPPPSPTSYVEPSSQGGIITALVIGFMAFVLLFIVVCRRKSRARTLPPPEPGARDDDGDDVQQLHRAYAAGPTTGLPVFTYRSYVKHDVTGGGEEAATCSVCLGALEPGERVRVLPLCMHVYHVECIDPWLDAHSTCPLCRSDTNPTMDIVRLPPV